MEKLKPPKKGHLLLPSKPSLPYSNPRLKGGGGWVHTVLPTNRPSQVFVINRNATAKLNSINTIHIKQHNVGFFIFTFTLKYMLRNVYIK